MRKTLMAAALLAAIIFAAGFITGQIHGITPSSAAGNGPSSSTTGAGPHLRFSAGPHAAGQVTTISGNTITITPSANRFGAASTVTTVVVSGTTQYRSPGTTGANEGTIKVGSYILATGTLSSDGKTLTATQVIILPNGAPRAGLGHIGPVAGGQVTAINGNTITVKPLMDRDGQASTVTTITVTNSTQYFAGLTGTTKNSIKVGSYVMAQGTLSADGKTLTATRVEIRSSAPRAGGLRTFGPAAAGQVTGVNGDTISIKPAIDRAGQAGMVTAIVVNGSTKYFTAPHTSATLNAVKVGSFVIARGTLSSDGKTLTAAQIMVLPSAPTFGQFYRPFGGFHGFGQPGTWSGGSRGFVGTGSTA